MQSSNKSYLDTESDAVLKVMLPSEPQERKLSADINDIFSPNRTKTVAYLWNAVKIGRGSSYLLKYIFHHIADSPAEPLHQGIADERNSYRRNYPKFERFLLRRSVL